MSDPTPTPTSTARRSSIFWLVLVLIAIVLGLSLLRNRFFTGTTVNEKLSALDLAPLTGPGRPVTLHELQGKVALVNLFATWCGPCQAELPDVAELGNEFAARDDFVLLAVSCGGEDFDQLRADTRELLARLGLDLPTYADPTRTTRRAFEEAAGWGGGVPTTFVLDRQGVIRKVWTGGGWEDQMRAEIERLLEE
jgi:thiol-disulfide isomerase/thioredoxin